MAEIHAPVRSILLVECEDGQALLVQTVLKELKEAILLYRVADVDQALKFLSRASPYESVPAPDLVLLDIDLPGRRPYDVLDALYNNPALKHVPVVIVSASDTSRDKAYSLSRGAFVHFAKPRRFEAYKQLLWSIVKMIPAKRSFAVAC